VGCPTPPGLELTSDCEWHSWFEGILAIDIGGPLGTPLYSVCDGVVSYRGFDPRYPDGEACVRYLFGRPVGCGYGYMVDVRCDDGRLVRYGHLASPDPVGASAVGDPVARGQVIGLMGTTGYSSGPHLHFEIREGWETLCPLPLIPPGCVV
jgi:murein DD-endopeptidase MepM/ murein hydrolase activator NlpD